MRYCDYCEYPTHRANDCPFLADEMQQLMDEQEMLSVGPYELNDDPHPKGHN